MFNRLCRQLVTPAVCALASASPLGAQADTIRADSTRADSSRFEFRNPNTTRLFFAPTGRTLAKGEGYVSDFYVVLPGINVGITDRVSIGGMVSIVPGVDLSEQIWFITPKIGLVKSNDVNVAAGALMMQVDGTSAGILYGVGTFGGEDGSLTGGLGYGYAGSDFATNPFLMLGGEYRLGTRVSLVTENWTMPGAGFGLVSGGFRFMAKGLAVDLGFMRPVGSDADSVTIPLLGFMFKW